VLRVFAARLATPVLVDLVATRESKALVVKVVSKVPAVSLASPARQECKVLQACAVLVVSLARGASRVLLDPRARVVLLVHKVQGVLGVLLALLASLVALVKLARWDLRVAEDLLAFVANRANVVIPERQVRLADMARQANMVLVATLAFQVLVVSVEARALQVSVSLDLLVVLVAAVCLACRDPLDPEGELATMARQAPRVRRAAMARMAKMVKTASLVLRAQLALLARKAPRATAVNPSCKCISTPLKVMWT